MSLYEFKLFHQLSLDYCYSFAGASVIASWVNLGSGNGLLPDGTKPLPEPMLTYHQSTFFSAVSLSLVGVPCPATSQDIVKDYWPVSNQTKSKYISSSACWFKLYLPQTERVDIECLRLYSPFFQHFDQYSKMISTISYTIFSSLKGKYCCLFVLSSWINYISLTFKQSKYSGWKCNNNQTCLCYLSSSNKKLT